MSALAWAVACEAICRSFWRAHGRETVSNSMREIFVRESLKQLVRMTVEMLGDRNEP